jgi:hypothetical protein
MRRSWALLLTPVLAMFFFVFGSPSANAFGSEVLGCAFDNSAWSANSCSGGGDFGNGIYVIHFTPHNMSGTYSTSWTVFNNTSGTFVTGSCGGTSVTNCIWSGCTASATTCDLGAGEGARDRTYTVTLTLTQSGQTRSIQASALVHKDPGLGCPSTGCQ